MKRVAFLSGPMLGHVARVYQIAWNLRDLGDFDITLVAPNESAYLARLCSGQFATLNLQVDLTHGRPTYVAMAERLDSLFAEHKFDAIVHDMCPVQWLCAVRFPNCPRINVTNVFLTKVGQAETYQTELFALKGKEINELRTARGLPAAKNAFEFYEADCVLLADPPALVEQFGDLPPDHVVCGVVTLPADSGLPAELADLESVVLLSMGSTGLADMPPGMLSAIKAMTRSKSIVYAGSNVNQFRSDPCVDRAFDWLPIDAILGRTNVAITQGGTGSTYQALMQGIPVFVFPTHRNQVLLGELLEGQGAGRNLDYYNWREKVNRLDFKKMRISAADFAPPGSKASGAAIAAQIIADRIGAD